jgi:uncharacterized phiE125 gp8 family phage protein
MLDADLIDEDPLIQSLIASAVDVCQCHTGRLLASHKMRYVGVFKPCIELGPNLISVELVKYIDQAGDERELVSGQYYVDEASIVGAVFPVGSWPSVRAGHPHPVVVEFTAGYKQVPDSIKQCIRLLVGHWFRNRDAMGSVSDGLKCSVDSLLSSYRVPGF